MSVRRSPAETYIKYLVVSPARFDNQTIRKLVVSQSLDFIGMPYVDRIRSSCVPPQPFYPEDLLHKPSQRFLRKERLELLFHPDKAIEQARAVLEYPKAKEIIESMLIARSEPAWISRCMRKAGFDINPDGVVQYKFHFFNVDLVDSVDLRVLLTLRDSAPELTDDRDELILAAARGKAAKTDSRVMAAQQNIGPMAAVINQIRLGVLPSNIELGRMISAARVIAVAGATDHMINGWAKSAQEYALVAKIMTETLEQVGVAEKDLQAGLTGLLLATEQQPVPHLDQLSQGQHTVEMQVIEAPKEMPALDSDLDVDSPINANTE